MTADTSDANDTDAKDAGFVVDPGYTDKPDHTLVLRSHHADGRSAHADAFVWPQLGDVTCPDWDPRPVCGNGLHGLAEGRGNIGLLHLDDGDERFAVVQVLTVDLVHIDDEKVKFPRGIVVASGPRTDVCTWLQQRVTRPVPFGIATAGYEGTATAGDRGTATAGDRGIATAGDWGTATAGYEGTATAGDRGIATAGYEGTATAGNRGIATAGDWGTATAGDWGTAIVGDGGTATASDWGTATVGNWGTATAGNRGTVVIRWYDAKAGRYRFVIGYVGEDGILPNIAYRLDVAGRLTPVQPAEAVA